MYSRYNPYSRSRSVSRSILDRSRRVAIAIAQTASGVARHGAWPSAYGRWHPRPMMGRVDSALSLVGSFVFPGARARRLPLPRTHSPLPRTHFSLPRTHFSLPRTHSLYQDAPLAPGHRTLSLHSLPPAPRMRAGEHARGGGRLGN